MVIPWRKGNCVAIADCHCETPLRRCGNLIFTRSYEIASLIVFARNDILTPPSKGEHKRQQTCILYVLVAANKSSA